MMTSPRRDNVWPRWICSPGLPQSLKAAHLEPGAGHYGIFAGKSWRNNIRPLVLDFIAANNSAESRNHRKLEPAPTDPLWPCRAKPWHNRPSALRTQDIGNHAAPRSANQISNRPKWPKRRCRPLRALGWSELFCRSSHLSRPRPDPARAHHPGASQHAAYPGR